jgi:bifunctional non-homologous end joining protein LigD
MAKHSSATNPALHAYQSKRDFKKSPEPTGQPSRRRGRLTKPGKGFFCVQKHLASHLHYDFRLEHGGVLLSWAVPRGPSLNPRDKRLAMRVEDHPLDYGDFEGVIPEGYGAGIVMLWDRGTWTAEKKDVEQALEAGELKFSLDGTKLKGSWVLVRTAARSNSSNADGDAEPSRSWLLIKHKDEWAGPVDVLEAAPLSVKSFGDLADILAADQPDVWNSNRPAKGGLAGEMLQEVIDQAARRKAGKTRRVKKGLPDKRGGKRRVRRSA